MGFARAEFAQQFRLSYTAAPIENVHFSTIRSIQVIEKVQFLLAIDQHGYSFGVLKQAFGVKQIQIIIIWICVWPYSVFATQRIFARVR